MKNWLVIFSAALCALLIAAIVGYSYHRRVSAYEARVSQRMERIELALKESASLRSTVSAGDEVARAHYADPAAEAKRLLERLEHEPTSIGFLIADTPSLFVSTKPLEDLRERVKKETDELRAIAESLRPKS